MSRYCYKPALGLLLIRVATGIIFAHHGLMKLQNVGGITGFFGSLGLPAFMVYIVALVELIGGLMLIFGVVTRAAAVATGWLPSLQHFLQLCQREVSLVLNLNFYSPLFHSVLH